MKLTIEEGNYLELIVKRAKSLYGNSWERMLEKNNLPLPQQGFGETRQQFKGFDTEKEEKVLKQLQKKNIVVIRKKDVDIQKQGGFLERYADQSDMFIGLNPRKIEGLKKQLNL